jgi:hypothetical protein
MSQELLGIETEEEAREMQSGGLSPIEKRWRNRQRALEEAGYMLRPRYHPEWQPSWTNTDKFFMKFEDGQAQVVSTKSFFHYQTDIEQKRVVIDATRISDGKPVMLKLLPPTEGPYELQINQLVSSEPLLSDPRNHCVPLLDVIELPNEPKIMVQPRLRPFDDPPIQTYGEFIAFFSQLCEVSDDLVV